MESLGEMWSLVVVGGFIVLAVAIAVGLMRNSKRDRSKDAVTEAATKNLYDHAADDSANSVSPDARPADVKHGDRAPSHPM